ncbi:MAG: hypothetical protein M2R45_05314 [Verrucomicrobia subdivision 3 bacterium]|nr:hypothetical protein [Limisphaerales bacterium]MCS1415710.1 hypothetical protein [Limisphaerales bacterium]
MLTGVMVCSVIGAYALRNSMVDVYNLISSIHRREVSLSKKRYF